MTDREELPRLAQAATPGPWRVGTPPPNGEQTIGTLGGLMVAVATTGWGVNSKDNADFIAAANPAVVLELLDEIERLRAVFDAARRVLKNPGCHQPMTMLHKAVQAVMFAEQGDE